jgi:hypothetical protein
MKKLRSCEKAMTGDIKEWTLETVKRRQPYKSGIKKKRNKNTG